MNAKITFRMYLLNLILLPSFFIAQITQEPHVEIYVPESTVFFDQNFSIAKPRKVIFYISANAKIYAKENTINAEFIKEAKTSAKKSIKKRQEFLVKKISKKIKAEEKKYPANNSAKTVINSSSNSENSINSSSSVASGVVTPLNSFPKFIIANVEYETALHHLINKNAKVFYQNFAFSGSYHFHICVRPPPVRI